jgi:hypothetical protein
MICAREGGWEGGLSLSLPRVCSDHDSGEGGVCVSVCLCVFACARACACACVRACVRECAGTRTCVRLAVQQGPLLASLRGEEERKGRRGVVTSPATTPESSLPSTDKRKIAAISNSPSPFLPLTLTHASCSLTAYSPLLAGTFSVQRCLRLPVSLGIAWDSL